MAFSCALVVLLAITIQFASTTTTTTNDDITAKCENSTTYIVGYLKYDCRPKISSRVFNKNLPIACVNDAKTEVKPGESWTTEEYKFLCIKQTEKTVSMLTMHCFTASGAVLPVGREVEENSTLFSCTKNNKNIVTLTTKTIEKCYWNKQPKKEGDTWFSLQLHLTCVRGANKTLVIKAIGCRTWEGVVKKQDETAKIEGILMKCSLTGGKVWTPVASDETVTVDSTTTEGKVEISVATTVGIPTLKPIELSPTLETEKIWSSTTTEIPTLKTLEITSTLPSQSTLETEKIWNSTTAWVPTLKPIEIVPTLSSETTLETDKIWNSTTGWMSTTKLTEILSPLPTDSTTAKEEITIATETTMLPTTDKPIELTTVELPLETTMEKEEIFMTTLLMSTLMSTEIPSTLPSLNWSCQVGTPVMLNDKFVSCKEDLATNSSLYSCPSDSYCQTVDETYSYCCRIPQLAPKIAALVQANCELDPAYMSCLSDSFGDSLLHKLKKYYADSPWLPIQQLQKNKTQLNDIQSDSDSSESDEKSDEKKLKIVAAVERICANRQLFHSCKADINVTDCHVTEYVDSWMESFLHICQPQSLQTNLAAITCAAEAIETPRGCKCAETASSALISLVESQFTGYKGFCRQLGSAFSCLKMPMKEVCGAKESRKHLRFLTTYTSGMVAALLSEDCRDDIVGFASLGKSSKSNEE